MITLRQKQSMFVIKTAALIQYAYGLGFELTYGETWRSPQEAARQAAAHGGIANSLHTRRLAVDFNLFKDGEWLTRSEDFKPLGDYWKSLSEEGIKCCWGGDWVLPRVDGNHFSIEHEGVR